jgi:aryl-alcohol dehydrogenase-like predicted oxidoreductase
MTFGVGGAQARAPGQLSEEEAHALLDKFVAAGGNFIDTANVCVERRAGRVLGWEVWKRNLEAARARGRGGGGGWWSGAQLLGRRE